MDRGIIGLLAGGVVLAGLGAAVILPRSQQHLAPIIGGPFALTDGAGHHVTDRDFRGRWMLVYFGYTHCPDACPTTLSDIGAGLDKLTAEERRRVAVIFITVDPARDTPAVIGAYARAFGPEFVGLTGSQAALSPVEQAFHVYAQKHDLKGGDYAMDHSSIIYVIGPDGRFLGLLDDQLAPADIAKRLKGMGA
jgi:protein SCO1/2